MIKKIVPLILIFILISCSKDLVTNEEISIHKDQQKLLIHNNTSEGLFFFFLEKSCVPVIDWIPTVEDNPNYILAGKEVSFNLSEIMSCKNPRVVSSDTLVFYYWKENFDETKILKNLEFIIP